MMRAAARQCPSQRSWGPPYGTKPSPMTETPSSWNTWTWKSSCRKTAFPPARPSRTTAPTRRDCRQPRLPPQSWTSAAGPRHPFTPASRLPPACRALSDQLLPANRNTPSPIDPDTIQVPVGYEPDPADLALSSVPGQEMFDPRKRKFSEEELKPQPMIKKARKVFIPDDLKDDKYWARRRKNNMAAKRSRDARRLKENQIAIRASFLEKENSALRQEVADLRKELGKCKNILAKYEARHGPL
ncbi:hepatic leukemia factor isoform X3 [Ochotona curzoniae]|uniref:hepatic leukemia factor isoform X3 n=1 Tax=Ochotona curzoniae TaxID=130825 RepID=UPI001B35317F|nr:hepatic leukemia factor isoform X3 [Ochotona curzoniae]